MMMVTKMNSTHIHGRPTLTTSFLEIIHLLSQIITFPHQGTTTSTADVTTTVDSSFKIALSISRSGLVSRHLNPMLYAKRTILAWRRSIWVNSQDLLTINSARPHHHQLLSLLRLLSLLETFLFVHTHTLDKWLQRRPAKSISTACPSPSIERRRNSFRPRCTFLFKKTFLVHHEEEKLEKKESAEKLYI